MTTSNLFLTGFFIFPKTDADLEAIKFQLEGSDLQVVTNMDLGYFFIEELEQFSADSQTILMPLLRASGANYDLKLRF